MKPSTMFNIYVMSMKRHHLTVNLTAKQFEYCTYVVRESEVENYRNAGIENILAIPEGAVCDFMSTFYWIIQNTPEEVICIVDDDIKKFSYRIVDHEPLINKDKTVKTDVVTAEIERIGQMIYDLDLGLAFDNPQPALYVYDKEFSFKGMPGHIRWVNKSCFKAKYNPEDPATSDIDMMYQELLLNRIVWLPKYIVSHANMDTMEGSITEDRSEHINLTYAMKNKWGRYYSYDYKKNQTSVNIQR